MKRALIGLLMLMIAACAFISVTLAMIYDWRLALFYGLSLPFAALLSYWIKDKIKEL